MFPDLRDWLSQITCMNELLEVNDPVDRDVELGAIASLAITRNEHTAAIMFNNIKGYPDGYRVLVNALGSQARLCHTLKIEGEKSSLLEIVKRWREHFGNLDPIPYRIVNHGAIQENVHLGEDINLSEFPTPLWHEKDGGRYIGTACQVITRDPDNGSVNVGTYRVMIHDDSTLGFYISPGKHGRIHRDKYFKKGRSCPVAMTFGQHPLLYMISGIEAPYGMCEYDFAGAIAGEPVDVIEGPITGLPIPANAEIAIEGESDPEEKLIEGPFGEATGYYGSSSRLEPIIRVKSILHRNNPILCGAPPTRPPSEQTFFKDILASAQIWNELEKAGVPGVTGVWRETRFWLIVAIEQLYPGHAKQAALVASQCGAGAYKGRYIIVVDSDIDPTNNADVLWAIQSRSDPENSIDIIRRCWSSALDPVIPASRKGLNSRAIIEATRPYEWIDDFPEVVAPSPKVEEEILRKWNHVVFRKEGGSENKPGILKRPISSSRRTERIKK